MTHLPKTVWARLFGEGISRGEGYSADKLAAVLDD